MPLTKDQRVQRARIAATVRAARTPDTRALTAAANAATWQRFLDQVPPEITDPAERERRARMLRRAYMQSLALRSSRARSARKAAPAAATA